MFGRGGIVLGLWFGVAGFEFRVSGFGFGVSGFEFRVWSLGFGVWDSAGRNGDPKSPLPRL